MEFAPLTKARDHSTAAHTAVQTADTSVAISQYSLAAGEFAKAATGTTNNEATRILRLLEDENRQLSTFLQNQLNKAPAAPVLTPIVETPESIALPASPIPENKATKNDVILKAHPLHVKQSSTVFVPPRAHNRELSSSIASGLASARGIRSNHDRKPLAPSVTTQQAPGNLQASSRRVHTPSIGSGIPPPITGRREPSTPTVSRFTKTYPKSESPGSSASTAFSALPTKEDEGFATWSATFGNILSRLSAPLAFAGLPLSIDTEDTTSTATSTPTKSTRPNIAASIHSQDVTKLFSKTALHSIQYPTSTQESFYHVPTTGHSASYANILLYDEKERRRNLAASMHSQGLNEDDEDFQEAYERMPTSSSKSSKNGKSAPPRSAEALELENACLKESLDAASKRLATFENASQSSHLAMQESIRFARPISPPRSRFPFASKMSDGEAEKRLRALSERYEGMEGEVERLKKENEKLGGYIQRYRDKFENLKLNARRKEGGAERGEERARYMAG